MGMSGLGQRGIGSEDAQESTVGTGFRAHR